MAVCDVCGNEYDAAIEIRKGDQSGVFDSFECAIHAMAPACGHCGCRVIGHGIQAGDQVFCCAHCARESGVTEVADRV